jgi:glycosyltransferase involved in cell wall biosynthesis
MLFVPFSAHAGRIGGPNTFMRNLQRYLDRRGVPYTDDAARGSAIFFPIAHERAVLEDYARRGCPIVQRLDGVYHRERNGLFYPLRNRPIKHVYRKLATFHVFQSEYSRQQCFAMFGDKPRDRYTTIVNGVDSGIFHPAPDKAAPGRPLRCITSGSFRHLDMLGPIVAALDTLAGDYPLQLTVAGPVQDALRSRVSRPYVTFAGPMDATGVAALLRESDLYIFSSLNPACPNALLEAVASGLPVAAFADGSVPELLQFAPELLAQVPARLYVRARDLDPTRLAGSIRACLDDYPRALERARAHSADYDFEKCGDAYVRCFEATGCL